MARPSTPDRPSPLFVTQRHEVRHGWLRGLLLGLLPLVVWVAATWFYQASQIDGVVRTPNDSATLLGWGALVLEGAGLLGALGSLRAPRWRPLGIGVLGGLGLSALGGIAVAVVWTGHFM